MRPHQDEPGTPKAGWRVTPEELKMREEARTHARERKPPPPPGASLASWLAFPFAVGVVVGIAGAITGYLVGGPGDGYLVPNHC